MSQLWAIFRRKECNAKYYRAYRMISVGRRSEVKNRQTATCVHTLLRCQLNLRKCCHSGEIVSLSALMTARVLLSPYTAEHNDSVAFIDYDYEDDPSQPIFIALPYVCGRVMLTSVLDSLVTMVRLYITPSASLHIDANVNYY